MNNEIKIYDNKGNAIDINEINKGIKITNEYRKIRIFVSKKNKKDGGSFIAVKAQMYLDTFTKEGISLGKRNVSVDVSFTKEAFDDCPNQCGLRRVDDLKSGYLYVLAKYIQAPFNYKVKKNDEDKLVYPKVWVKGGIVGFEPLTVSQDAFEYHEVNDYVVDDESGEVIDLTKDEDEEIEKVIE